MAMPHVPFDDDDSVRSRRTKPLSPHVVPHEFFTFQYSDVPVGPPPGQRRPTDRLIPGQGIVQWKAVFDLLREKGYGGYLSFEAPNPTLWARPPAEVTREAAEATRRLLAA